MVAGLGISRGAAPANLVVACFYIHAAVGFYDQLRRRGTRTRYEDEEPRVVKRRKVAMVPVGATAVNRMKDG